MSHPPPRTEFEPRRLELTLDPINGSLQTAPLLHVLLTATDGLYRDLYQMAAGDIDVAVTTINADDENNNNNNNSNHDQQQPTQPTTELKITRKRERMADLAFAQRRHELAWRLARHARSVEQLAALTAAAATSNLAEVVHISSHALQHARTAWVQADEAQDALYFFHAQLFPLRAAPHDILGAADVQLHRAWYDMARDMQLQADPYETSVEAALSKQQVSDCWQTAVRRKLLTGEAGNFATNTKKKIPLWKLSLQGGLVRLTCGNARPRTAGDNDNDNNTKKTKQQYPIAAVVTVVPSGTTRADDDDDEWTLLSLDVQLQAKTGEFNYQLECSNRQKYDLHRLAALAMSRAEANARALQQQQHDEKEIFHSNSDAMEIDNDDEFKSTKNVMPPARPLDALFQVAHTFLLSWQLEVLSAQALGLRRGAWGAVGIPIQIHPVQFLESSSTTTFLGTLSIAFWKIDDSYGPPSVGRLSSLKEEYNSDDILYQGNKKAKRMPDSSGQLVLSITAECGVGIQVSLSGAKEILTEVDRNSETKSIVQDLLEATANPFALSASDALLAAARLCAYQKCQAVVRALQPPTLPDWIALSLDRGSIVVAAKLNYYYGGEGSNGGEKRASRFPILFRMQCDLRTGSFVPTFARSFHLLSTLAGADSYHYSGEVMATRVASLPASKRRAAGAHSTGRCVREAFDGLMRSMNLLGQRVGVGGSWDDIDPEGSPKLRQRAIQGACADVRTSLTKCCALSALYGLAPVAVKIAVGLDASPDIAGAGTDKRLEDISLLAVPPLSVRLQQELIEETISSSDGVPKKYCHIEQILFALACRITPDGVTIVPLEVLVRLDSPAAEPTVEEYEMLHFDKLAPATTNVDDETGTIKVVDPVQEAGYFADLISLLVDETPDEVGTA